MAHHPAPFHLRAEGPERGVHVRLGSTSRRADAEMLAELRRQAAGESTILGDSGENRLLGRDQVWFTEKLHDGSTRLYPLTDLDPRKHEAVGKRYLAGRYGASPILSDRQFDRLGELIGADV